jgi:ubiquinone/menaquinone biosynthesis C-methylase UbiE
MPSFLDPEKIIEHIDILPGMRIADFGSGHGYYTIPFAKRVGDKGKVYALDVQEAAVEAVRSHARLNRLANVEARRVNLEADHATGLHDNTVDMVFIANILFQAEDKPALAREAHRILTPSGAAAVIEWQKSGDPLGPPPSLRVSPQETEKLMIEAGFTKERDFDAGAWHYGIIFKK